ncbi:hypothetical protein MJO28_003392 [Puccinia striiformis f. sp. tritici]|uniref:Uncharacterized protein n=1 Tax=Puccinia striiformis f. sp. tritici TaxID=168172 RepID=A0ACC0EUA5_9BASI|nr:hypothetical protein MJO28_003392 [Puccinia striiformis f. sp. tritici]
MKYYLRFSKDDYQSNIRGLIFESYAHVMLRDGGRFQARRLCGSNVASGQNVEVAFCPAKVRFFQAYEEIKLVKNVLWRLLSKNLPSIDSLFPNTSDQASGPQQGSRSGGGQVRMSPKAILCGSIQCLLDLQMSAISCQRREIIQGPTWQCPRSRAVGFDDSDGGELLLIGILLHAMAQST